MRDMNPLNSVLWTEGEDWRCAMKAGPAGTIQLEVYKGGRLIVAEATIDGRSAARRAEILRERVLRGDLRTPTD